MQYQKLTAKILSLALLLGLSTSIVGCETAEVEEGGEEIEEPIEEGVEEE